MHRTPQLGATNSSSLIEQRMPPETLFLRRKSKPSPHAAAGEIVSAQTPVVGYQVNEIAQSTTENLSAVTTEIPIERGRQRIAQFIADLAGGSLFRKGVLSLVDQGVVSAVNFLTMVLVGRTLAH